ncbi:uncharacterized protein LTR77_003425 [Saxophila tyrrhenica]|uniref:Uncharacterized protein n=1 Tax=Saxophila tyrrhenica TaxID=1690608 RepID=A0AAV9PHX7_9PEZI|nr:hypothetical protein LTR77_003425 [Saxophila tyrrhenica]
MSTHSVPGITSPTQKAPTTNTKPNRLPAPTLFVGPPSRNASQLSVARPGISREKSTRARNHNTDADGEGSDSRDLPTLRKPSERSIDAKWREMQSTLNEVELTAQSSTHVFGESHAKALDELRNAQIALAKAWGRGNDTQASTAGNDSLEPDIHRFKGAEDLASERKAAAPTSRRRADTGASASTVLSDESQLTEDSARSGRSHLEDETAQDIKLASERRAANEAYFKKVDQGVKEVVEKLEKVAEAMRGVEGESRSLWSQSERSSSGSEEGKRVSTAPLPERSISPKARTTAGDIGFYEQLGTTAPATLTTGLTSRSGHGYTLPSPVGRIIGHTRCAVTAYSGVRLRT